MANRVTKEYIDQIISVINKNYLVKSGMAIQRGGAYGKVQIYLIDKAEQALHYGAIQKQLCSGSTGEVYNYLNGMESLGDILFRISPYRKANRAKGNPITKGPGQQFSEVGVFTHEGKSFSSGGSVLFKDRTGRYHGLFYAFEKTPDKTIAGDGFDRSRVSVGTWDGSKKVRAAEGTIWRDNFGSTRQTLYFTWDGIPMTGVWFKSQGDIVRARQTGPVKADTNPIGGSVQVPPNVKVIDGTRMELFNTRLFGGTGGLSGDSLLTEGLARVSSENEARSLREHGFKARSIKVGDQYCVYAKYRKGNPTMTRKQAETLANRARSAEYNRVMRSRTAPGGATAREDSAQSSAEMAYSAKLREHGFEPQSLSLVEMMEREARGLPRSR
jgi:hypothetical protein